MAQYFSCSKIIQKTKYLQFIIVSCHIFIYFQAGIIPYIAISLMDMLGEPNTAKIVHYVMCVFDPPYIIFGGIYYIDRVRGFIFTCYNICYSIFVVLAL